jgi:hypothetical protein
MATIQTVIDNARQTLNDDDKVRWPDAECLTYAQDALDAMFYLRPDLFHGQFATIFDSETLTLASVMPISDRFRRQVGDYIIFRCETKDEEAVLTGRSQGAVQYFERMLLQ